YRHTGKKYASVPANEQGRHPIPELNLEIGLLDGWVRFWYQGQLLPLPADLQRELEEAKRQAEQEKQRAAESLQRLEKAEQRADKENLRAEKEKQRPEKQKQRAEDLLEGAAQEGKARRVAERELAQLRARLEQLQARPPEGS